jgi:hypothetical protein
VTDSPGTIRINPAPMLTLWAAVLAERLGLDRATPLTIGRAVAGLSAYAKGNPGNRAQIERYMAGTLGDRLEEVCQA